MGDSTTRFHPERAISDVREFTERHREMRALYRDYRDVADVINPDMDDAKVGIRDSLPSLKVQSGKTIYIRAA
jgi:hypothetical protein